MAGCRTAGGSDGGDPQMRPTIAPTMDWRWPIFLIPISLSACQEWRRASSRPVGAGAGERAQAEEW
eukprot:1184851-Prymnesium_polylepis.1